jgi:hypothetical protein
VDKAIVEVIPFSDTIEEEVKFRRARTASARTVDCPACGKRLVENGRTIKFGTTVCCGRARCVATWAPQDAAKKAMLIRATGGHPIIERIGHKVNVRVLHV